MHFDVEIAWTGARNRSLFNIEAKLGRPATAYRTGFKTGELALFDEARGGRFARPPLFESGGGGAGFDGR